MRYNLIIDTNVLVSFLLDKNNDSAAIKVFELIFDKKAQIFYSDQILNEYKIVLSRPEFSFNKSYIGSIINYIKNNGILINPIKIYEILRDDNDMPFYELVMDTRDKDSKLITGNKKHFPNKIFIMKPREFINFISKHRKKK